MKRLFPAFKNSSKVTAVLAAGSVGVLALGLGTSFAVDPVPPPPSVGAEVDSSYFGPLPSQSFSPGSRHLVGPKQLLRSGTINNKRMTTTIPLYEGRMENGKKVWYILTDTTDKANADSLGLNFSAKLAYATQGKAVRKARLTKFGGNNGAGLTFDKGAVDFSPERRLVPGSAPNFFPPKTATPGSVGDADYTPYVQVTNAPGTPIYNAPVVAYDVGAKDLDYCKGNVDHSKVHDRVVAICPSTQSNGTGTVTLKMTPIFSFAKPATYISTEASDRMVATMDMGTFAPALGDLETGRDDSAFSAIERLFVTVNGPTGMGNPQRQGLNSSLSDKGPDGLPAPPLHVIGGIPTVANDYSPAWDVNLGMWTKEAIDKGYRSRVHDEFQILGLVRDGWITGPMGKKYGSSGIVVNCPIVQRFL